MSIIQEISNANQATGYAAGATQTPSASQITSAAEATGSAQDIGAAQDAGATQATGVAQVTSATQAAGATQPLVPLRLQVITYHLSYTARALRAATINQSSGTSGLNSSMAKLVALAAPAANLAA